MLLSQVTELPPHLYRLLNDETAHLFPQLEVLDASRPSGAKITDEGLSKLARLKEINISNNNDITNDGISKLPELRKLNVTGNSRVTDLGISALSKLELLVPGVVKV